MKIPIFQMGQVGLLLTCAVLITSCNKQEEFFEMEEFVAGVDAYCSQAEDVNSCLALGTFCQPAYEASEFDMAEPVFAACVANRGALPTIDSGPDTVADDGSSTGTDDGTIVDDGSSTGPDDSDSDSDSEDVYESSPGIDETVAANCANLDDEFLFIKKQVRVKKGSIQSSAIKGGNGNGNGNSNGGSGNGQSQNPNLEWRHPLENAKASNIISKVKVCHHTGNGAAHTIIIACPALKAHVDHHDDYIGVCKL